MTNIIRCNIDNTDNDAVGNMFFSYQPEYPKETYERLVVHPKCISYVIHQCYAIRNCGWSTGEFHACFSCIGRRCVTAMK